MQHWGQAVRYQAVRSAAGRAWGMMSQQVSGTAWASEGAWGHWIHQVYLMSHHNISAHTALFPHTTYPPTQHYFPTQHTPLHRTTYHILPRTPTLPCTPHCALQTFPTYPHEAPHMLDGCLELTRVQHNALRGPVVCLLCLRCLLLRLGDDTLLQSESQSDLHSDLHSALQSELCSHGPHSHQARGHTRPILCGVRWYVK